MTDLQRGPPKPCQIFRQPCPHGGNKTNPHILVLAQVHRAQSSPLPLLLRDQELTRRTNDPRATTARRRRGHPKSVQDIGNRGIPLLVHHSLHRRHYHHHHHHQAQPHRHIKLHIHHCKPSLLYNHNQTTSTMVLVSCSIVPNTDVPRPQWVATFHPPPLPTALNMTI